MQKKIYDVLTGKTTIVDLTDAEKESLYIGYASLSAKNTAYKLEKIRSLRLQRLQQTDYMSASDITMPDYIKTWRQSLRDLPQDNTTDSQYDTLLEKNSDGSLKHAIWKQPTE
jgi:hypothetical protein|tara:strand:- start:647 stop:985 length:339 start_codon:yes stop_codon:yes gene_type:complete